MVSSHMTCPRPRSRSPRRLDSSSSSSLLVHLCSIGDRSDMELRLDLLSSAQGPQSSCRLLSDVLAASGNTISPSACLRLGVAAPLRTVVVSRDLSHPYRSSYPVRLQGLSLICLSRSPSSQRTRPACRPREDHSVAVSSGRYQRVSLDGGAQRREGPRGA